MPLASAYRDKARFPNNCMKLVKGLIFNCKYETLIGKFTSAPKTNVIKSEVDRQDFFGPMQIFFIGNATDADYFFITKTIVK